MLSEVCLEVFFELCLWNAMFVVRVEERCEALRNVTPLFCETQKNSILQENKKTYFQESLLFIARELFELSKLYCHYHIDSSDSSFAIQNQVSRKSDV